MNYDEFNTEYTKVLDKIKSGKCSWSELSGHVTRLRQATAGITGPVERAQIDSDLAALGQMVDLSRRTNDKEDVWTVTSEAIRRASSQEGTVADRIARIELSITEISTLANRNPDERDALMQSTSTLRILHASLQSSLRTEQAEQEAAGIR
ncbi:hypothetical protein EV643_117128 [Kribbella sp. VKM Ac-2527]|uniref:Uncharacterized protein n=1 Tax=Kribbella caucasensis TaxID=2512215 RepID=A0A4R6K9F9_9ACTN|nr:hypothetical protein [Kribbella sp. VKM Ac-2527]TDO44105.1 hypothetical protein EV643_117128 [Kribbella sp. VKM Ac-2527]